MKDRAIWKTVFGLATMDVVLTLAANFSSPGGTRHRFGVSVVELVVATYVCAAIVAFVLSRWAHLATTKLRAVALGSSLAIFVSAILFFSLKPESGWRAIGISAVLFGSVVGTALALATWIDD